MGILNFFRKKSKKEERIVLADKPEFLECDTIRLVYVGLADYINRYTDERKIGETWGVTCPFKIPKGMTIENACKVISYLSEKVEREYGIEPASEKSVCSVNKILKDFGFKKLVEYNHGHFHAVSNYHYGTIDDDFCKQIDGVVDLFTFSGEKLFKRSVMYDRYFNWFTEGVTKEEVDEIYKNLGNATLDQQVEAKRKF